MVGEFRVESCATSGGVSGTLHYIVHYVLILLNIICSMMLNVI